MAPRFDRETTVFVAKSLADSERYEDAIDLMKRVALRNVQLSKEERNLIVTAYKTVIASRRASWRTLVSHEENPTEMIKEFVAKVVAEINGFASEITSIITDHALALCASAEDEVYYYTMIGDCFRYRAELTDGDRREELAEEALAAYRMGTEIAEENLHVADVTRLTLVLNFSVFYYGICNSVDIARDMAQRACDAARSELSNLNEQARMESEKILTLHSINLAQWANPNV